MLKKCLNSNRSAHFPKTMANLRLVELFIYTSCFFILSPFSPKSNTDAGPLESEDVKCCFSTASSALKQTNSCVSVSTTISKMSTEVLLTVIVVNYNNIGALKTAFLVVT